MARHVQGCVVQTVDMLGGHGVVCAPETGICREGQGPRDATIEGVTGVEAVHPQAGAALDVVEEDVHRWDLSFSM